MRRSAGTSRGGRVKGASTNLISDGKGRLCVTAAARHHLSSREEVDPVQSPSRRTPATWAPSPHQQGPPPESWSPPHKPRGHRHRRSLESPDDHPGHRQRGRGEQKVAAWHNPSRHPSRPSGPRRNFGGSGFADYEFVNCLHILHNVMERPLHIRPCGRTYGNSARVAINHLIL
jgi:hypothetical protein